MAKLAAQVNASLNVELAVLIAAKMNPHAANLVAPVPLLEDGKQGEIDRTVPGVTAHRMRG